jgi:hypothetical protein
LGLIANRPVWKNRRYAGAGAFSVAWGGVPGRISAGLGCFGNLEDSGCPHHQRHAGRVNAGLSGLIKIAEKMRSQNKSAESSNFINLIAQQTA